jgi:hypothetical protein
MESSAPLSSSSEPVQLINRLNRNFASLITTSLGVTAALSFNDAFKSMFEKGGVFEKVGTRGVWYTAIFTTFLAFAATFVFTQRYPDLEPAAKQNPIKI